ncbi:MAG TPA: hypothetical protein VIR27_21390 [Mycobacteriales bacterium]
MNADPRELRRLRTFYVAAPDSSDLRAAFVIDGRAYARPEQVRADIADAVAVLQHRRVAAQFFTEPVTPDAPVPMLPSWQDYRATL